MTDTATKPMMPDATARSASARSFFDFAAPTLDTLPPPTTAVPIVPTMDVSAVPGPAIASPAAAAPATAAPAITAVPPSVPQLPRSTPATPSAGSPAATSNPFAFSAASMIPPPTTNGPTQQKGGGARRFVSRVLLLAVLGGIVFAGVKYGPELLDRAKGDSGTVDNELQAPLAFPTVPSGHVPARTADLVIERPAADGTTIRYEVTNDFETGVSRMLIDRAALPDVEVLAVFDVANLHVVGQPDWFAMPRGEFPFGGGPERERWVRTIDEYLPVDVRQFVTIDRSTEAVLGTEPMRHLLVSIDTVALAAARPAVVDPTTGLAAAVPGEFVAPAPLATIPDGVAPVTVELWIDANGIVRKLVEPSDTGARTVTVVSMGSEAFNPEFPAAESVQPLTASQLIDFAF